MINIVYLPQVTRPDSFKTITLESALDSIQNGTYKKQIEDLRKLSGKEYAAKKRELPSFCFGGTFSKTVKNDNLATHSGLFHFDIDHLPDVDTAKAEIAANPFIFVLWLSPSKQGLKGLIRIPTVQNDGEYKRYFEPIAAMLKGLGYPIDAACKDVRRVCFVSFDPDLYINSESELFTLPETTTVFEPVAHKPAQPPSYSHLNSENDILTALEYLSPIAYEDWIKYGLALKSGGHGYDVFRNWSSQSPDFKESECLKKWNGFNPTSISSNTIFYDAMQRGYKPSGSHALKINYADFEDSDFSRQIEIDPNAPAKTKATSRLLALFQPANLKAVCLELGWHGEDTDSPKEKHYRVAITHVFIETAKKHNVHIIHNAGFFYVYSGSYWTALEDAEVKQLLKNASIRMGYAAIECRNAEFVDRLFKQAVQDGFFSEKNYQKQSIINLKNGSLVLSADGVNIKPYDHKDFLTHELDFEYNPTAINTIFAQYLTKVLPDADTRKTLQQVAGYLFIKGLKMEKIFFLFGFGSNGKSVFFEVLSGVMGRENISNFSLESLTDRTGYFRSQIKDKIVNYGTDIKLSEIDAGMFKTLASGEPIEARLPYRDPFIMSDYAKLIFNVNRMDSANFEHTHGFYRRLLVIPFLQTIPDHEQDRDLHNKILKDKAGVLNWIIDGAKEVIKNRNIFVSKECEEFKARILKESDSVALFEEQAIIEKDCSRYSETVTNAHTDYKEFCIEAGHKALNRTNFGKRMEALGFLKSKTKLGWFLSKDYFELDNFDDF